MSGSWKALLSAALTSVAWGAITGWVFPRGPLTTGAALISIGISLVAGGIAGYLSRSRWAMLASPTLFAITVEIVRLGAVGPTVDAPHASPFGAMALIAGRGVHGLLALLPMVVGAAYGAGVARRTSHAKQSGRLQRYLGRAVIGVLAGVTALVAVAVALPASTEPIPGERSVAELTSLPEKELGLMIRGVDTRKPILLFVPGAPGAAERGDVRARLSRLEQYFVVATLDRRGGGTSYGKIEPTKTFTLEGEVDNTVAAATYLEKRFRTGKVFLLAHSGGTLPAVLAAQRNPELFKAYVGVGQAVNTGEADKAQYADTLEWAKQHKDDELAASLTKVGPPPYGDIYGYEPMLLAEGKAFDQEGEQGGIDTSLAAPEYTMLDKLHILSGLVDSYTIYYPRARDVDLRNRVHRLKIPAYFIDGVDEVPARAPLMRQWVAGLEAPRKEHIVLAAIGHRSMFERPKEFVDIVTNRLLGS